MDLFPLFNSLRISIISTLIVVVLGILVSYYALRLPFWLRVIVDCLTTLPMILPPTVTGFFLLMIFAPGKPFGAFLKARDISFVMTWYSAVVSTAVVSFPFMYRTGISAFKNYNKNLTYAAQTLGLKNSYIFFRITLPNCKFALLSGVVLSFARGLGEYGATSMVAGYTPGITATISTTVYQLWRINRENDAYIWVLINLGISVVLLIVVNFLEHNRKLKR